MSLQLQINKKYEKLVPPLQEEDYDRLFNSIKENGLREPIIINKEGIILDGHNRFKICEKLNKPIKTRTEQFENKLVEEKYVIESNLQRRHLNDFQKAELGIPLLEIEKELAKENQRLHHDRVRPNGQKHSRDLVSKQIGVSSRTFERAKVIIEKAPEEIKQKVRENKISITQAYNRINNKKKIKKQESLPLPKGKYQILYADPPWFYGNFHNSYDTGKTSAELYNVMNINELKKLEIPKLSYDDSVLLMWVTYPCLEWGLELIKEWGFTYRTVAFTWVKRNKNGKGYFFGLGNYTRANAEICLLATKGKGLTIKSHSVEQICDAPLTKHSEKPDEIRDRIVELFGNVKRVELFARKKVRGWQSWGDEL